MDKIKDKLHNLEVNAIHLKHKVGKFGNLLNSNHRHDEEHEQLTDAKRTRIAEGHRFQSYAPERGGNDVKWYIDGRDYFHALSVALERAKEVIYIADWWLSPELFLRRPAYYNQEWRLDYTLKRAAERGVKIYIIVYREVEHAFSCNSQHTKRALMNMIPEGDKGYGNIVVMRHPDHNVLENASDMTFYWAHHEKFVVIDFDLAFIGGLDLCFGRWDNRQHPLADVHPAGVQTEIFPGQDFNNNRIMDFQSVNDWKSNELSKAEYGRMPWHDIHMGLVGPCIWDIAEHFVLRWNFCKRDKYKRDERYDWLTLAGRTGDDEDLVGVQRPKHPVGEYIHHPFGRLEDKLGNPRQGKLPQHPASGGEVSTDNDQLNDIDAAVDEHGYRRDQHRHFHGLEKEYHQRSAHHPEPARSQSGIPSGEQAQAEISHQENPAMTGNNAKKDGFVTASGGVAEKEKAYAAEAVGTESLPGHGTLNCQLVRSSADWSSGILVEQSIQNAYCEVIRAAKHYVYIENQFFITATGDKQAPVHNLIGAAVVDACLAAHKAGRKFRVIIMLPAIPGFAGDLRSTPAMGTRAIMDYQYKSICRGEESIYGKLRAGGADPEKYIFVFNLRSYDRLNKTPALLQQEKESGVKYSELQREHAEEIMPEGIRAGEDEKGVHAMQAKKDDLKEEGSGLVGKFKKMLHHKADDKKDPNTAALEREENAAEHVQGLSEKRRQFEDYQPGEGPMGKMRDPHDGSRDSIARDALLGQKLPSEETYSGRDDDGKPQGDDEESRENRQQEVENFVQEELYIHAKLLIVDDRIAICGSSNINDRSQIGFHDSELSIVMEDTKVLPSKMDGAEFSAGHHAATLRRMLWREHLGLLPPQDFDASDEVNAQPPSDGKNDYSAGDEWDKFVEDPMSDDVWNMWTERATTNTLVFRTLFHADPDDNVRTFEDYDKFLGKEGTRRAGHLYDLFAPVDTVRAELDKIKGHLVWMPLKFLEDAEMAEKGLQVNSFTESGYT